jgi:hypothetical protein
MRRQVIEFQRLDVGEGLGRVEAGNSRNRRVCSEVEENPIAGQEAFSAT